MSDFPGPKRGKSPWLLLFLLLLALAAGGFALLAGMDKPPAFMAFLLPSSSLPPDPPARARPPAEPLAPTPPARPQESAPSQSGVSAPVAPSPQPEPSPAPPSAPPSTPDEAAPSAELQTPAEDEPKAAASENGQDAPEAASPTESAAPTETPQAPAADQPQQAPPQTPSDAAPLVIYGKGRPVNPQGSVVRGRIPDDQDQAHEAATAARLPRSRYLPGGQDSVVGAALVDDMARFLADNYWPEGTHPQAGRRGISTAGVKWANMRYGAGLIGFSADRAHPDKSRARILDYVFVPSMIRGLYSLYEERFFQVLEGQALDRAAGPQGVFFTNAQVAGMFAEYALKARGLALAIERYRDAPGIRAVVKDYADAYTEADSAYRIFLESREAGGTDRAGAERRYREAVRTRESSRRALAAVMRSGTRPGGLDDDSLAYTALWLYRRGDGKAAALTALAEICASSAARLADLETQYKRLPPQQIARHGQ